MGCLTLTVPLTKKADFSNNLDPDEVAYYKPAHQELCCLSYRP